MIGVTLVIDETQEPSPNNNEIKISKKLIHFKVDFNSESIYCIVKYNNP